MRKPFSICRGSKHQHHKFTRYGTKRGYVKLDTPKPNDFCCYCLRSRENIESELAKLREASV